MTLLEKITDLNDLILQGKALDAFEKYYHEEVVMQENENQPTIGKEAMVQWLYDYTHKDWGIRNYKQVSVQQWRNGQIIKEQFFYGN
ncbi:MAG: nuclear transport factor 2 family protein [Bacteroidetes bacterium]|nr:nuclear transport factor 2 family protein [Bacteroidota bacterium]